MQSDGIDWFIVRSAADREIGALGFIGDTVAIVVAFYDDRDGNYDGKVSLGERIVFKLSPLSLDNKAVTEVAMAARLEPAVLMRDPAFAQEAMKMYLTFARGLIADGVYAAYLSQAVGRIATPIAGRLVTGTVKQYVVRKGMEKVVKELYERAVK